MKTISPVLNEQVVMILQQALDTHLKAHGLAALEGVNLVAQALAVPWSEPAAPAADTTTLKSERPADDA